MADDRARWRKLAVSKALLAGLVFAAPASAEAAAGERILVFGFELVDTSGEEAGQDHGPRLRSASELLVSRMREAGLDVSGPLDPRPDGTFIRSCNGCEAAIASEAGADIAATGTVRKVSTLILSITIALRDAATGDAVSWTADIRGDNERSWLRGVDWLADHRVLPHFAEAAGGDPGP
ncbi:MAG TPA: DUF3280 domain-containing protein [Arenibaculum sp.]|nr:DUF3280 domain-containing protein [Arenibaculum sp.]